MKAVRFHGKQDLRVENVPEPSPGPGQVKVKNAYAGICGSDLHIYYDPGSAGLDIDRPHPITGARPPQVLGHEFSGTIVELGSDVSGLEVGDRVAVWPVYYCGECSACRRGLFNACRYIGFHGVSSHGGGMAEFTVISAEMVHRLPDTVDLQLGALVEPMAVAWHAMERSGVTAADGRQGEGEGGGRSALIAGAGPIGIGMWFALRAHGVETIVVTEPSAQRRKAITGLGATRVVDPATDELSKAVADATDGQGVDVVFDAAGAGAAVEAGLRHLTPRGNLVVVALHERAMEFNPTTVVMSETEIRGALAYLPSDFDAVITAMSQGAYRMDGWVEVVEPEGVESAIQRLRDGQGMKVLVRV